jgi:hypothetical protein
METDVKYEKFDPRQVPLPAATPEMIYNASWSGDDNMGSVSELECLGHHVHAADNNGGAYI